MARGTKRARSRPPAYGIMRVHRRKVSRMGRRRRRIVRRRATRAQAIGPAIMVNPRKPRVETVTKYVYNAFTAYNQAITSATVQNLDSPGQYFVYQFDPAATAAAGPISTTNYHVRVSGQGEEVGTLTASGHAFPDWASYSGLYQEYKVRYIRVVHTLRTTETSDSALFPTLYMRAYYGETMAAYTNRFGTWLPAGSNALRRLLEHTRVKKMTFNGDAGAMSVSYKLYPRNYLSGTSNFVKQKWTPMSTPRALIGLVEVFEDPIPVGQIVSTDIEWCVSFKTRV